MKNAAAQMVSPAFMGEANATEFNAFLAERCDWTANDFGGEYAWNTHIPARDTWEDEIEALNAHLATL